MLHTTPHVAQDMAKTRFLELFWRRFAFFEPKFANFADFGAAEHPKWVPTYKFGAFDRQNRTSNPQNLR